MPNDQKSQLHKSTRAYEIIAPAWKFNLKNLLFLLIIFVLLFPVEARVLKIENSSRQPEGEEQCYDNDPPFPDPPFLGQCVARQNNTDFYDNIVVLEPILLSAEVNYRQHDYKKVEEALVTALRIAPKYKVNEKDPLHPYFLFASEYVKSEYYARAVSEKENGNYAKAIEFFSVTIEDLESKKSSYFGLRAECYEKLQQFDEARSDLRSAIRYASYKEKKGYQGRLREFNKARDLEQKKKSDKKPTSNNGVIGALVLACIIFFEIAAVWMKSFNKKEDKEAPVTRMPEKPKRDVRLGQYIPPTSLPMMPAISAASSPERPAEESGDDAALTKYDELIAERRSKFEKEYKAVENKLGEVRQKHSDHEKGLKTLRSYSEFKRDLERVEREFTKIPTNFDAKENQTIEFFDRVDSQLESLNRALPELEKRLKILILSIPPDDKKALPPSTASAPIQQDRSSDDAEKRKKRQQEAETIVAHSQLLDANIIRINAALEQKDAAELTELANKFIVADAKHALNLTSLNDGQLFAFANSTATNIVALQGCKDEKRSPDPWFKWRKHFALQCETIVFANAAAVLIERDKDQKTKEVNIWNTLRNSLKHLPDDQLERLIEFSDQFKLVKFTIKNIVSELIKLANQINGMTFYGDLKRKYKAFAVSDVSIMSTQQYHEWLMQKIIPLINACFKVFNKQLSVDDKSVVQLGTIDALSLKALLIRMAEPFTEEQERATRKIYGRDLIAALQLAREIYRQVGHEIYDPKRDDKKFRIIIKKLHAVCQKECDAKAVDLAFPQQNHAAADHAAASANATALAGPKPS